VAQGLEAGHREGIMAVMPGDSRFKKRRTNIDPAAPRVGRMFDNVLSPSVPSPPKQQPGTVCPGADPVPNEVAGNKHGFSAEHIRLP